MFILCTVSRAIPVGSMYSTTLAFKSVRMHGHLLRAWQSIQISSRTLNHQGRTEFEEEEWVSVLWKKLAFKWSCHSFAQITVWRFGLEAAGQCFYLWVLLHEFLHRKHLTTGALQVSLVPWSPQSTRIWPSADQTIRCRSNVFTQIIPLICQRSVPQKEHFCSHALWHGHHLPFW